MAAVFLRDSKARGSSAYSSRIVCRAAHRDALRLQPHLVLLRLFPRILRHTRDHSGGLRNPLAIPQDDTVCSDGDASCHGQHRHDQLVFLDWPGAMGTSSFITIALILILWRERRAFQVLFWKDQPSEARSSKIHWVARSVVLLYALLTLLATTVGANAFKNFADSYQRHHPNERPR